MPTALVTGASSGIGKAFAVQLASEGYDLVLVARTRSALEAIPGANEIIVADLGKEDERRIVQDRLAQSVDLLVNNAGYAVGGSFLDQSAEDQQAMIDLNITAVVQLAHAAAPAMAARGRGAILNVSSIGSFQPGPRYATYSATKSFVTMFSEALHVELKPRGVTVTALCPGFTRTGFQTAGQEATNTPDFLWMEPDAVAKAGLDALRKGKAVCIPGAPNKVAGQLPRLLPRAVIRKIAGTAAEKM